MFYVMVTSGKRDSIDYVEVKAFDTNEEAKEFCDRNDNRDSKYYVCCEIISLNTKYEIRGNDCGEGAEIIKY